MSGIASIILGLAVAAAATLPAVAQQTVRIGLLQPLSGGLAPYALETTPAMEHIVRKINAEGGIKSMGGAKLEIVVADTASQPAQAAREARRLVTQENVDLIVGAMLTSEMMAVAPVIDEYKAPTISLFAGATQSPHMFSLGLSYDAGYAGTMVDFVGYMKKRGHKIATAATSYSNYEGGQQINRFAKQRLEAIGVKVVADVPLDTKAQDLLAAVLKIKQATPDVVVGLQLHSNIINLQKARHQIKYFDAAFIGSPGFGDLRIKKDLGPEVSAEILPKGMFGMALYAPSAKIAAARAMAAELQDQTTLKAHFGQYSLVAAQTVRVVQQALEIAGSKDKAKVVEALARVKFPLGHADLYLPLPNGLAFDDGRMIRNFQTMMVQWSATGDPMPEVVYPEQFATAAPRPVR